MYEPTAPSPERLPQLSYAEGLHAALAFAKTLPNIPGSTALLGGIEITWDEENDSIRDLRTCAPATDEDIAKNPNAQYRIHSLATGGDTILAGKEAVGGATKLRLVKTDEVYFDGFDPDEYTIFTAFATHTTQYQSMAALLREAVHYDIKNNPSFTESTTLSLVKVLSREPEQIADSRELLAETDLNKRLSVDGFRARFEKSLVRELAPNSDRQDSIDLNLTPEQIADAATEFEKSYGFSARTFASPFIYKSFAFSQILHRRLATDRATETITGNKVHPSEFAGKYVLAILDAAAQDPNRNADKIAKLRSRICINPKNGMGEARFSWTNFAMVADGVARHNSKADGDKAPQLSLLDPRNTRDYGQGLLQLLRLTQTNTDTELRQLQEEQDTTHAEIVEMLLNGTTRRALGKTALQPNGTDTTS